MEYVKQMAAIWLFVVVGRWCCGTKRGANREFSAKIFSDCAGESASTATTSKWSEFALELFRNLFLNFHFETRKFVSAPSCDRLRFHDYVVQYKLRGKNNAAVFPLVGRFDNIDSAVIISSVKGSTKLTADDHS